MATAPQGVSKTRADRKFDVATLLRTASWGIGAAAALLLAVLASLSDAGTRRFTAAVSEIPGATEKSASLHASGAEPVAALPIQAPPSAEPSEPQPQFHVQPSQPSQASQPSEPSLETRQLREEVRVLVGEQDRLVQRIAALERSLAEATGVIREQLAEVRREVDKKPPAPVASGPVSTISWPAIVAAIATSGQDEDTSPEVTASIPPGTPLPLARPGQPSEPSDAADAAAAATPSSDPAAPAAPPPKRRTAHGIDLGGAPSVDQVRTLWRALQASEPALLQGLRPVMYLNGTRGSGKLDVRLIAGPISDEVAAAKLCSALLNAGRYCEPAAYRGQRLSAR